MKEIRLSYQEYKDMEDQLDALQQFKKDIEMSGDNIVVLDYIRVLNFSIPTVVNYEPIPHLEKVFNDAKRTIFEMYEEQKEHKQKHEVTKKPKFSWSTFWYGLLIGYITFGTVILFTTL